MAITLEDTSLGYEVEGPETYSERSARVGLEMIKGKIRLYISTTSRWATPAAAEEMILEINECLEAINELVATLDPDLLHESNIPAASAPGIR